MKKFYLLVLILFTISSCGTQAQFLKSLKEAIDNTAGLTEQDAVAGIREALVKGTNIGVDIVSVKDGYFGNSEIKIPSPPEAEEVESALRKIGLDKKVDEVILTINRAAELAAEEARSIFVSAITNMTVVDAINIVKGEDNAATVYLNKTTSPQLNEAFYPIIAHALDQVDATRYWEDVIGTYNKLPFVKKMNPDLADYVTHEAINGLFVMIEKEELKIRKDPVARTTEILKKVFGNS